MNQKTAPKTGGCYCGKLRYEIGVDPILKAQCHCRPCQYITGGGPNYFMLVATQGFAYTQGTPATFAHPDVGTPVTREFCATCGTHLVTRLPEQPIVVVKVGSLDQPSDYSGPKMAIHCLEKQPFHMIPEDIPVFDRLPDRS